MSPAREFLKRHEAMESMHFVFSANSAVFLCDLCGEKILNAEGAEKFRRIR